MCDRELTAEEAIKNFQKAAEEFAYKSEEEKKKAEEKYLILQIGVTQSR